MIYRNLVDAIEYKQQTEVYVCRGVRARHNLPCEIMDLFGNRSLELSCVCASYKSH